MDFVKTAAELSENDDETAVALNILRYISEKFTFDHGKNPPLYYVPDLTEIYAGSKGVCFDFAALYAAMCRSAGIPARLVMGYTSYANGYHAWCEIFANGEWIPVDPTNGIVNGEFFVMEEQIIEINRRY